MNPLIPSTVTFRESILPFDVEAVEKKYNATFVGDFCLRTKSGDWANEPVAVFWQETPPVEGYSNYFALFTRRMPDGQVVPYITSGASAVEKPIAGIVTSSGEVLYSRYRHDYRSSKDGNVAIDGGRDYVRLVGDIHSVTRVELVVDGPTIRVVLTPQV